MCCKKLIIVLFLFISGNVFAQELKYPQVDSTSYILYENQKWDSLISFGEKAAKQGFDYYFLNLRIAIALYNTAEYYTAEKYFNKTLKHNKTSAVANEYLYIIKLISNRPLSADINYNRLADSIKIRLDKRSPYFIPYIYFEGGIKISNNKNIEANEPLARFFVEQKITRRFNLRLSTSYIGQQNAPWGSYDQTEVGLFPSFALLEHINLDLGWRYINVRKDYVVNITQNFVDTANTQTVIGPAIIITDSTEIFSNASNFLTQINAFYGGVTVHENRFSFFAKGLVYIQNIYLTSHQNYETSVDKIWILNGNDSILFEDSYSASLSPTINSNTITYIYQAMLGASYTLPIFNNGFIIRFNAFIPLNDDFSNAVWVPSINARIFKSLWFYGEWLQKKRIPLLYHDGNTFLNQSYQLNHRLTLGLTIILNNRFQFYLTYLNENKHYFDNSIDNSFNAAIFGINLKF